jgi:hypothetical protein
MTGLTNKPTHIKGRQTIRRGGSLTGMHGPVSRPIRLWTFDAASNTTLARLEQAYLSGLEAVDRIEEHTRSNVASGKLTPEGVKDASLKFALSDLVPVLHKSRSTIKKAKAEVTERKAKLKVEGPDKSDVAGALRRMEIRTFLRNMRPDDQSEYFRSYGDDLPAEVAIAVLELPPEFSGVPKSRHDLMGARALEAQHGPEMAAIAELEDAVAVAESAVETGRDEVRLEAGAPDEGRFNELAAKFEKQDAPWLRRRKDASGAEEIRVVDIVRGVERRATPDEIERGAFYQDYDHFKEGKAA